MLKSKQKLILFLSSALFLLTISYSKAMETQASSVGVAVAQPSANISNIPQELKAIIISIAAQNDNLIEALAEFKKQAALNREFRNIVNNPIYIKYFIKQFLSRYNPKELKNQHAIELSIMNLILKFKSEKMPKELLKTVAEAIIEFGSFEYTYSLIFNTIKLGIFDALIDIFKRNKEIIRNQVSKTGSDNNNKNKLNPLLFSVINNLGILKFLISIGADINAVNAQGKTVLEDVLRSGLDDKKISEIVNFLRKKGAKEDLEKTDATNNQLLEEINRILKKK